ncbi:MAG: hypothetical protein H7Y13_16070 [Sphingobacteriaceae bacterium]|nr:hypothetical protein [Sphingobacteriaceae bacterium]
MAGLSDAFGESAKKILFQTGLSKGDIFLNKFDVIDHEKFFIVAGVSDDKIFTCSIYINSEIHPSLRNKPDLIKMQSEKLYKWKEQGSCKVISKLIAEDLKFITAAIINSGLLAQEEIELYFK